MTMKFETSALDDALLAFQVACPFPSMEQTREWEGRYPQFKREIRAAAAETAEVVLSGRFADEQRVPGPEDDALASRALAVAMGVLGFERPTSTLRDRIESAGRSVEEVASLMRAPLGLVDRVVSGVVDAPASRAFYRRMAGALDETVERIRSLHEGSLQDGRGHASAASSRRGAPMTYADAVADTAMPDDQKSFWLGEG